MKRIMGFGLAAAALVLAPLSVAGSAAKNAKAAKCQVSMGIDRTASGRNARKMCFENDGPLHRDTDGTVGEQS